MQFSPIPGRRSDLAPRRFRCRWNPLGCGRCFTIHPQRLGYFTERQEGHCFFNPLVRLNFCRLSKRQELTSISCHRIGHADLLKTAFHGITCGDCVNSYDIVARRTSRGATSRHLPDRGRWRFSCRLLRRARRGRALQIFESGHNFQRRRFAISEEHQRVLGGKQWIWNFGESRA